MADRRPDRLPGERLPARRSHDDRTPAHRQPTGSPLHSAKDLEFVHNPGRGYWWDQLGEKTRSRLLDRVGDVIEWWAYIYEEHGRRPYAVLFGKRAFAISRPVASGRARTSNQLLVWSLLPTSHRFAQVNGTSYRRATTMDRPETGQRDGDQPATVGLPPDMRGFLGNLPEEAQHRLQAPFMAGDAVFDSGNFYTGDRHQLNIWCFLAGSRTVTFASGRGLRRGRRGEYSWELVCRQADVAGSPP